MAPPPAGWVVPWWWQRQADPATPEFVPGDRGASIENRAHREVVALGGVGTGVLATVDPRGLVRLSGASWSLDWWVGSDQGWRFPSREPAVRQHAREGAPVIESRLRVAGGEVVQRVWVARIAGPEPREAVVVEVHNATAGPIGLAWAVRPFHDEGVGRVEEIVVEDAEVRVDGEVAMALGRTPGRWCAGTLTSGDAAVGLVDADGLAPPVADVVCPHGLATLALVEPLPHTATRRVVLGAPVEGAVPPADAVARGWRRHLERQVRLVLPAGVIAEREASARGALLVSVRGEDLVLAGGRPPDPDEEALLVGALDAFGFADEAGAVLGALEERIAFDGYLGDRRGRRDANGALLAALGTHVALSGDSSLATTLAGPIAKAAHWIDRRRRPGRAARRGRGVRGAAAKGMFPEGPGPRWCGGRGVWPRDLAWSLVGLRSARRLLATAGQPEAAGALDAPLGMLEEELAALLVDRGAGSAWFELAVLCPEWAGALLEGNADLVPDLVPEPASGNPNPLLTAWLVLAELGGTAPSAHRLHPLAAATPSVLVWPEALHPVTRGGVCGEGWYPPAAAAYLLAIRSLLAAESDGTCWWSPGRRKAPEAPSADLRLLAVLPEGWEGQPVEVHGLPTGLGALSYGVRWHGPRPALLWEIEPHDGPAFDRTRPPVLSCPGLDPHWRGTGWSGEALLASVADVVG